MDKSNANTAEGVQNGTKCTHPVSFQDFSKFVKNLPDIAFRIQVTDIPAGQKTLDDCALWFYNAFFTDPAIRAKYKVELNPCPLSIKKKLFQAPSDGNIDASPVSDGIKVSVKGCGIFRFPVTFATFERYIDKSKLLPALANKEVKDRELRKAFLADKSKCRTILHKYYNTFYIYPRRRSLDKFNFVDPPTALLTKLLKSGIPLDKLAEQTVSTKSKKEAVETVSTESDKLAVQTVPTKSDKLAVQTVPTNSEQPSSSAGVSPTTIQQKSVSSIVNFATFEKLVINLYSIAGQLMFDYPEYAYKGLKDAALAYYLDFYLKPEIRDRFAYQLVPCPAAKKNLLLSFPNPTDVNVLREMQEQIQYSSAPQKIAVDLETPVVEFHAAEHEVQQSSSDGGSNKLTQINEIPNVMPPVSFALFKQYIRNIDRIVEEMLSCKDYIGKSKDECALAYYKAFYAAPEIRKQFKYEVKPCPANLRTKLLTLPHKNPISTVDTDCIKNANLTDEPQKLNLSRMIQNPSAASEMQETAEPVPQKQPESKEQTDLELHEVEPDQQLQLAKQKASEEQIEINHQLEPDHKLESEAQLASENHSDRAREMEIVHQLESEQQLEPKEQSKPNKQPEPVELVLQSTRIPLKSVDINKNSEETDCKNVVVLNESILIKMDGITYEYPVTMETFKRFINYDTVKVDLARNFVKKKRLSDPVKIMNLTKTVLKTEQSVFNLFRSFYKAFYVSKAIRKKVNFNFNAAPVELRIKLLKYAVPWKGVERTQTAECAAVIDLETCQENNQHEAANSESPVIDVEKISQEYVEQQETDKKLETDHQLEIDQQPESEKLLEFQELPVHEEQMEVDLQLQTDQLLESEKLPKIQELPEPDEQMEIDLPLQLDQLESEKQPDPEQQMEIFHQLAPEAQLEPAEIVSQANFLPPEAVDINENSEEIVDKNVERILITMDGILYEYPVSMETFIRFINYDTVKVDLAKNYVRKKRLSNAVKVVNMTENLLKNEKDLFNLFRSFYRAFYISKGIRNKVNFNFNAAPVELRKKLLKYAVPWKEEKAASETLQQNNQKDNVIPITPQDHTYSLISTTDSKTEQSLADLQIRFEEVNVIKYIPHNLKAYIANRTVCPRKRLLLEEHFFGQRRNIVTELNPENESVTNTNLTATTTSGEGTSPNRAIREVIESIGQETESARVTVTEMETVTISTSSETESGKVIETVSGLISVEGACPMDVVESISEHTESTKVTATESALVSKETKSAQEMANSSETESETETSRAIEEVTESISEDTESAKVIETVSAPISNETESTKEKETVAASNKEEIESAREIETVAASTSSSETVSSKVIETVSTSISDKIQSAKEKETESATLAVTAESITTDQQSLPKSIPTTSNSAREATEVATSSTSAASTSNSLVTEPPTISTVSRLNFDFFAASDKEHNMKYLIYNTNGVMRNIWRVLSQLSYLEFKTYTAIYESESLYKDETALRQIYDHVNLKGNWPINLYLKLTKLSELLHDKGIYIDALDLGQLSPKILHWHELCWFTNFSDIVENDFRKRTGGSQIVLLSAECELFYVQCWTHNQWFQQAPKITDKELIQTITQHSSEVVNVTIPPSTIPACLTEDNATADEAVIDSSEDSTAATIGSEENAYPNNLQDNDCPATQLDMSLCPPCFVDMESVGPASQATQSLSDPLLEIPCSIPFQPVHVKVEPVKFLNNMQFVINSEQSGEFDCQPITTQVINLDSDDDEVAEQLKCFDITQPVVRLSNINAVSNSQSQEVNVSTQLHRTLSNELQSLNLSAELHTALANELRSSESQQESQMPEVNPSTRAQQESQVQTASTAVLPVAAPSAAILPVAALSHKVYAKKQSRPTTSTVPCKRPRLMADNVPQLRHGFRPLPLTAMVRIETNLSDLNSYNAFEQVLPTTSDQEQQSGQMNVSNQVLPPTSSQEGSSEQVLSTNSSQEGSGQLTVSQELSADNTLMASSQLQHLLDAPNVNVRQRRP